MNFLNDKDKMIDFKQLTKEQFLKSYSYITEKDYDDTKYYQDALTMIDWVINDFDKLESTNIKLYLSHAYHQLTNPQ